MKQILANRFASRQCTISVMLTLRALDPAKDLTLYQEAYNWRMSPKRNTRVNRMSFEEFAMDDPHRVVIGLFNGSLCAVYMFVEIAPKVFEAHFSSRKDADVNEVFAGGKTMLNWFHDQGAEVWAWVVERNRPLRAFVEALGFQNAGREIISRQGRTEGVQFPLVKYVSKRAILQ